MVRVEPNIREAGVLPTAATGRQRRELEIKPTSQVRMVRAKHALLLATRLLATNRMPFIGMTLSRSPPGYVHTPHCRETNIVCAHICGQIKQNHHFIQ